eukprot:COSAG06_NODE_547_length_14431_cov_5.614746_12_plen_30_part_00
MWGAHAANAGVAVVSKPGCWAWPVLTTQA